jgi:UDP-N-acetylmuramate--alanine ligase
VIISADDKNSQAVISKSKAQIIKWTTRNKSAEYSLKEHTLSHKDYLAVENKKIVQTLNIHPKAPGKFNIGNASVAAIVSQQLNIKNKKIEQSIKGFTGTWRRLELKHKKIGKCKFIDDYGHHPTEIQTTLTAIRETYPKARILCVFQPHQYSRTRLFLKDFGKSFSAVNEVIIPNIYKVRDSEAELDKMSTDLLVKEIQKHHSNAKNGNGLRATANYIKKNHSKFDLVVTMGAGDIDKIYKML